jgi:hypothetical protein
MIAIVGLLKTKEIARLLELGHARKCIDALIACTDLCIRGTFIPQNWPVRDNRWDDYSRDPCDRRLQNEEPVQSTVSTAFGWTQNPLL